MVRGDARAPPKTHGPRRSGLEMKPVGLQTLRSRWFAIWVHLCLWFVLCLAAAGIGGKTPDFRESDSFSAPAQSPAPVASLEELFAGRLAEMAAGNQPSERLLHPALHS